MGVLDPIEKEDLRDYLARGWLTHDGMWFFSVAKDIGVEAASRLNRAAILAMAPFEMQRTKKILGIADAGIDTFEELVEFLKKALETLLPDSAFRRFNVHISGNNSIRWEWENGECFAFRGISQTGMIGRYKCGVIYRLECWLDTLGISYSVEPLVEGCMMHEKGYCRGEFKFSFPERREPLSMRHEAPRHKR